VNKACMYACRQAGRQAARQVHDCGNQLVVRHHGHWPEQHLQQSKRSNRSTTKKGAPPWATLYKAGRQAGRQAVA
jgi:hypothetical protein